MQDTSRDMELKNELKRALHSDKNLRTYALNCDVVAGEARLSGIVDALTEKKG